MVKLAKRLKKNNVAVDVVAFGDGIEEGPGAGVLKAFVEGASSGDNSCVPLPLSFIPSMPTFICSQTSGIHTPRPAPPL